MALIPVAGSKFYLGTTATTASSDTFTVVANVESIDKMAATAADIKVDTIDNPRTQHLKGQVDGGTTQITLAFTEGDTGQDALAAAQSDQSGVPYNIRWILPNKATGTGTGTTFDVKAQIASFGYTGGGPNKEMTVDVSVYLTSAIIKTAAT